MGYHVTTIKLRNDTADIEFLAEELAAASKLSPETFNSHLDYLEQLGSKYGAMAACLHIRWVREFPTCIAYAHVRMHPSRPMPNPKTGRGVSVEGLCRRRLSRRSVRTEIKDTGEGA